MIRALYFFGSMHVGFGFVGLSILYFGGSIVDYGAGAGFLVNTPLAGFAADEYQALRVDNPLDFGGIFSFVKALGGMVYSLVAFNYEIVTSLTAADGAWFWVAVLIRLVGIGGTVWLGFELYQVITRSGLLQSNWGAAVVLGGMGITAALGIFGFVFG